LAINNGVASIKSTEGDIRRLLLHSEDYETKVSVKSKASVAKGQFVKMDSILADSGEISPVSGQVVAVDKDSITIRNGRPSLISQGTQLQVEAQSLVLRGDNYY